MVSRSISAGKPGPDSAPAGKDASVRTIAIVNQKGGCGKTTTAINLAALYARRGLRTLLVDMDPQAHCAAGLGVPESRIEFSIGHALLADLSHGFDPEQLVWEVSRNLYLAPSTMMLSALEAPGGGLHQLPDRDRRLESLLAAIGDRYDRCLIDCPPTIGLLTFNALRAAREALIPVETGFFSLRGAEKQWATIQRIIHHIGRPIACHLLPTLHNPESKLACNILAALRRQFAGQITPMVLREHESLREAASFGQPVLEYAPHTEATRDLEELADWLEEHAANPTVEIETFPSAAGLRADRVPASAGADAPASPEPAREVVLVQGGHRSTITPVPVSSRAAELVRRVTDLTARAAPASSQAPPRVERTESNAPAPIASSPTASAQDMIETARVGAIATAIEAKPDAPEGDRAIRVVTSSLKLELEARDETPSADAFAHLHGVRQISAGVLFVQPAGGARSISVAGDFNGWSTTAFPLRYNEQVDLFQGVIALPPGRYCYRLVIDGRWRADAHNPNCEANAYGETNSVIEVPESSEPLAPPPAQPFAQSVASASSPLPSTSPSTSPSTFHAVPAALEFAASRAQGTI